MALIERVYRHLLGIKWLIIICFILTQCTTQPEVNDMAEITLAGGFYQDSALQFDAQRSVNMYPDVNEVNGGKGTAKLQQIPGLNFFAGVSATPVWSPVTAKAIGMYTTSDDRLFVAKARKVSTNTLSLFEYLEDGTLVSRGDLSTSITDDINIAKMTDNGKTLCIVVGEVSAFFDLTSGSATIVEITDSSYPANVTDVIFKDTYFIFLAPDEGRFYISSSYATDPTDCIDATEFGTVESSADDLVGLVARTNEILVFGTKTIEPFYNNANVDFPWARNNGGIQDVGTLSRASIATIKNDIFFLGSTKDGYGVVYMLSGYQLRPISTGAIEEKIREAEDLTTSTAYTYQDRGHYFYVLRLESSNTTLCYDATTGIWHERASIDEHGEYAKHYGVFAGFAWGRNFVSDNISTSTSNYGVILEYDPSLFYNILIRDVFFGNIIKEGLIPLERTLPHQTAENKNVIYNKFELDVQKGVGAVSGDDNDVDPVIELSMSRDGGMTWGEPMQMNIGKLGEYSRRARKKRLGKSRDTVFKLYSSSAVQMEWFKAYVDYEVLGD